MLRYLNPAYYLKTNGKSGYTIDQTILIVAIIAILITLIIVTIGWALLNRTSGTKLGSQLQQMEDAISQFYGKHRMFPTAACPSATTANYAGASAAILAGVTTDCGTLNTGIGGANELDNLMSGVPIAGGRVRNNFSGIISMLEGTGLNQWLPNTPSGASYIIVKFENVPLSEAKEADAELDKGVAGVPSNQGRVVYSTVDCLPASNGAAVPLPSTLTVPTAGNVNICFATPI